MKLKLKKLRLGAGRPVAFINEEFAKILNVHIGDRVEISSGKGKIIAIVDIVKSLLGKSQIGLSDEVTNYLRLKSGELVDVRLALETKSTRFIAKKLNGAELTREEIFAIINDIVNNSLTEAEVAYFVSGVYENGMSLKETIHLTEAMYKTGKVLSWHSKEIVDKHSIGGIAGNRTTPIIVPICASAGIIMPKTSSRAITSASGTADVIETIANVDLQSSKLKEVVRKTGACLAWGGSLGLAPSDDKLIRVERLLNIDPESQLIASIMAKKLAVGSKDILIDIPFGRNAKVSREKALKLKKMFLEVAKHFKLKMKVVLTDGSQPIGNGVGPVLEMIDVIKVLKREKGYPKDLEEKSLFLAGEIFEMVGKVDKGMGFKLAEEILNSGMAFKKFQEIISAQGRVNGHLKLAKFRYTVKSSGKGKIKEINNKHINYLCRILGCPTDRASGVYIYKHIGSSVDKSEPLITLYAESRRKLNEGITFLSETRPIKIE